MGLFDDLLDFPESKGQYLRRKRRFEERWAREDRWDLEGEGKGLLGGLLCWLFSCNDNTESEKFGFFGWIGMFFWVLVVIGMISKCSVDPKTDSVDIKTDSVDPKPVPKSLGKYDRYYVHTKSGVNIRSGPDTSHKVIGIINRGDEVYVNRYSDKKWVKVFRYLPGRFIYQGYVYRPLLHSSVSEDKDSIKNRDLVVKEMTPSQIEKEQDPKSLVSGDKDSIKNRDLIVKEMTPSQIEKEQDPKSFGRYDRYYVHSKSGVKIRSGPGTSHKVIGVINRGEEVYINRTSDKKWVRVFRRPPLFIYQGYVHRPLLHSTILLPEKSYGKTVKR